MFSILTHVIWNPYVTQIVSLGHLWFKMYKIFAKALEKIVRLSIRSPTLTRQHNYFFLESYTSWYLNVEIIQNYNIYTSYQLHYLTINEWGWVSYEELWRSRIGVIRRGLRPRRITPSLYTLFIGVITHLGCCENTSECSPNIPSGLSRW